MISFSQLLTKIKEGFRKMIGTQAIKDVLNVNPAISIEMQNALQLWEDMYMGKAPWLHTPDDKDPSLIASLGLPQLIASEKARTALLEFKSEITTPMIEKEVENERDNIVERFQQSNTDVSNTHMNNKSSDAQQSKNNAFDASQSNNFNQLSKYNTSQFHPQATVKELVPKGPTERAEYLNKQYQNKVIKKLRKELEYGIGLGGFVIKPYVVKNTPSEEGNNAELSTGQKFGEYEMFFDFVAETQFYPLAYNGNKDIIEAAFIQRHFDKNMIYTRVEHHKFDSIKHQVTVTNLAFKTANNETNIFDAGLGKQIHLSEVPQWANLQETTTINDVDRLLFAYFRMPEANTIDMYSPLGVSGFDKAKGLIEEADKQYSRLLWEYEGGEMAIDIDRDALRDSPMYNIDGTTSYKSTMGHLQQRLFRQVDLGSEGDTYNPFAPALRDTSYIQGLNTILTRIEDVTGLSRGTISETNISEARTATELRILKQRSYQTNKDIQTALQECLEDLVYIMDVLCDLYHITPKGEYNTSFEWDDSILVDMNEELGKRITLMQQGISSKIELRMWYYGETEAQAREALLKVQEENRQAVEDNIMTQLDLGMQGLDDTLQQSPDNFRGNE